MASDRQLLHKMSETSHPGGGEPLPRRKTCTGYHVYKILTIVYAFFYVLVGLLLLALGIWVTVIKREYDSVNNILSIPAILCMIAGLIIVISAIVGCVGASIDRLWPLRIFLAFIIVVFIIQVVIGVLAYVYREEAIENIGDSLHVTIDQYHTDKGIEYAIDRIQRKGRCCGFKSYTDWESNKHYSCASNSVKTCSVPDSCCYTEKENCGQNVRGGGPIDGIYTRGCETAILTWVERHLDILGATALGLAILHILGIFVVYMLITKVEDRIRLFIYRKRFYST